VFCVLLHKGKTRLKDFTDSASAWIWELDEHLELGFISANMAGKTDFSVAGLLHKSKWEQDLCFKVEEDDDDGKTHHLRLNGKPDFSHKARFSGYSNDQ
jgi:hypothetical protein